MVFYTSVLHGTESFVVNLPLIGLAGSYVLILVVMGWEGVDVSTINLHCR